MCVHMRPPAPAALTCAGGAARAENTSPWFSKASSKLLLCHSPELCLKAFGGVVYLRETDKHPWKLGISTIKFLLFVAETIEFSCDLKL